jgi:drug/metabolite transporter (DMT)-like permease
MHEDRPHWLRRLMVGSLCLLALQDSLVKLASADVSLWQFQSMRAGFNLLMLMMLARFIWGSGPVRPKRLWTVVLRSTFLVGAMICFFGAIPFLSLSQVAAGLYVFPLFVTVLSALVLREKVGPRRIMAVLTGFAGTLLILKPGTDAFTWASLAPVTAGLFYAATVLTTRKLCREEKPAMLALGVSVAFILVGGTGIAVLEAVRPERLAGELPYLFTGWNPLSWAVAGLILICSMLNLTANIGLAKAYQSAESSWLAPFDYSYLIFATFWGVVMWADVPDAASFMGMGMIAVAGLLCCLARAGSEAAGNAELNRALR